MAATAPTWSKWQCVIRIAAGVVFSSFRAPLRRSGSSPGSISSAVSEPSLRAIQEFSWTGPTVSQRASTSALLLRWLLLALHAVVDPLVRHVGQRRVDHERH